MKFRQSAFLAHWLVEMAFPVLDPWLSSLPSTVIVTAVPMWPMREFRRGFNQSEELARELATRSGLALAEPRLLKRTRKTKPQARYDTRQERLANLEGVFAVRDSGAVAGRNFLLIDDVMTTGATAAFAAKALKESGATEVYLASIVRARLKEDA
ncbi:hypothetical protein BH09SUM1_BH09SUM1_12880 [soil metagenome]